MKRMVSSFCFIIFTFAIAFSAFSFNIDGNDGGVEWDGAMVYKLLDGESNCGVNFGLVKVKFDYESSAVCFCFMFSEPGLTPDNQMTGISLTVEESSPFKIVAADGYSEYNIEPFSFEGAIYIDDNNGVTCEVRVGLKSGLPQSFEGCVRFIDSHGYYSNYYRFTVINENYVETGNLVIGFTDDDYDYKTTKIKTTKETTKKKTTSRTTTETTRETVVIKTSPPYSYTGKIKTTKSSTKNETTYNTTKSPKPVKGDVTVYYHEKEIIISQVYITQPVEVIDTPFSETTDFTFVTESETVEITSDSDNIQETEDEKSVKLSDGTKYKKIISGVSLTAFIGIACFGTYSARKDGLSDK